MPDSKITALTSISTSTDPANDPLVIVDVSDTSMAASGTTKKVTLNNLLACSPTATLASATITGDLTVDTSTLYVSSSADKVAIGTTSLSNEKLTVAGNISANAWLGRSNIAAPAGDCSIFRSADNTLGFGIASSTAMTLNSNGLGIGTGSPSGASGRVLEIYGGAGQSRIALKNDTTGSASTDGSQIALVGSQLVIQNREASEITLETNNSERYRLASDGVATWSNVGGVAGTAMTLNATGLGVGNSSPAAALDLTNTGITASREIRIENSAVRTFLGVEGSSGRFVGSAANNAYFGCTGAFGLEFATNNNVRMVVDTSGNVGIGVTPSARFHSKAGAVTQGGIIETTGANALLSFADAGTSSYTRVQIGSSGNNLAAFINSVQAMTLDASGNLLVGTTSTAGSASNATKTVGGLFSTINGATGSTATGVAATLFTAPNEAVFMVSAYIVGSAAAANYNAVAIVKVSGGNAAITTISSASNLTISLSGLNIQATQTSGVNQAFAYSAIRIS